ncbi:60S acidic ribosomal protein P2-like [Peromyscus leucopus]|uniref:60S acidic ribosomal protein P2-like n=1 Tax=Peromyscus leucopus TaxID=10041 RepID=UPI001884EB80|nr:60S acidic ribosomal protein P2-like [Peromyscus leucopus]
MTVHIFSHLPEFASYLLITLGATSSRGAQDVKKILDSVGIDQLNKAISELNERHIDEVRAQEVGKLAGGAAGGAAADFCSLCRRSSSSGSALLQAEAKKNKKEEESEESDEDMAFGWFNDIPAPVQIRPFNIA